MAVTVISFSGCATTPAPSGGRWVVSTPQAEFYKNGPAQDFRLPQDTALATWDGNSGPDFQLPRGAIVTMLQREFGYSRVITDEGVPGYVANEQLRPAPAMVSTAPTEVRGSKPTRLRNKPTPSPRKFEDQLDLTDLPLPLPG